MSRLVCCVRVRRADMGAALSHPQEGEACEGAGLAVAPPTMADVIRERKKKAGGAGLGTLRRRLAAAARRPRDSRPDRGCEHARFIRSVVSSWRVAEVFVLCEQLEAGAALRDLATQAELAREPAHALHIDLASAYHTRWWCDVELVGAGWSVAAHRAVLAARCTYFRDLLLRYPSGTWRVPLEGVGAGLTREEMEACMLALYGGATCARQRTLHLCGITNNKWERGSDDHLDIINVDNTGTCRSVHSVCGCEGGGGGGGGGGSTRRRGAGGEAGSSGVRRLGALLGFSPDSLHRDMRYLLDSGEYADSRLVFRLEGGCGAQYGFRSALELPCHRVILAARSRFFRSVMTRRTSNASGSNNNGNNNGCVCVDEKVLPRRFARALLHAAYTDQVDLSLIGRASTSPSSTNSAASNGGSTPWPGVARSAGGAGGAGAGGVSALDDAFQLYEIARFLEMPIVVQGCEDCIVDALSADTLPHILRWAAAPHASHWVHRQAMRYLRDEFPSIMSQAAAARLPRSALAEALSSPFLQASEAQALRALLRWGVHHQPQQREPNVVWHTAHSVSRRVGGGGRRRDVSDAALREALADLVTLVRVEHLPPDNELLTQAIRRGIIEPPAVPEETGSADAWLGRGSYRPARCFLPYLDELKALLEEQAAPEAEVARVRRARLTHRIPDTLYMVAAARKTSDSPAPSAGCSGAESAVCVSPRTLGALRGRLRELCAAHPAATALKLHSAHPHTVYRQIALRAVREMSLPDSCAELLLQDLDTNAAPDRARDRPLGQWEEPQEPWSEDRQECSRTLSGSAGSACSGGGGGGGGGGELRCLSAGSLRSAPSLHIPIETSRSGTCRRELPSRPDSSQHRSSLTECGRLSAAVPDVAMAPNANTHLLTARDYCRHGAGVSLGAGVLGGAGVGAGAGLGAGAEYGPVLQLDLGDGATHTPRPGSRALRAAQAQAQAHGARRDQLRDAAPSAPAPAPGPGVTSRAARHDDAELRAALQLSVIRAYSGFQPVSSSPALHARRVTPAPAPAPANLPHPLPAPGPGPLGGTGVGASTLPHSYRAELPPYATVRGRATPSPSSLSAASGALLAELPALTRHRRDDGRSLGAGSPGASPRRSRRDTHYRHEYRLDANYGSGGGSGSASSRGPSPNNYA